MNFFSSHSDESKRSESRQGVPGDILSAVSVMKKKGRVLGDNNPKKPADQLRGTSPFLEKDTPEIFLESETGEEKSRPVSGGSFFRSLPQSAFWNDFLQKQVNFYREKTLLVVLGGSAFLFLLGGTLVWYVTYSMRQTTVDVVPPVNDTVIEPLVQNPTVEPPYAPESANYLSIDTETVTPGSLAQLIGQAGDRIVAAQMTRPVEFLLTDKNNNPIAFSRFVYLMKLDFPEGLLAAFGEPFSFFVYDDGGKAHLGLGLSFSDPVVARKLIVQNEKSLPYLFRTVLYAGIVVPHESILRSGVYNSEPVRFVNIDAGENISFDFVVRANGLFIGTSKETLRAVLDKKQP